MKKYSLNLRPLPFGIRYKLGERMLRDNPNKRDVIIPWVLNQDGIQSSPGTQTSATTTKVNK